METQTTAMTLYLEKYISLPRSVDALKTLYYYTA